MRRSVIHPDQSVTALLVKWGSGDKAALDELIPLVYDELRKLAASYLRRRAGSHTLQATALVHEAYVRLADQSRYLNGTSRAVLWPGCEDHAGHSGRPRAQALAANAAASNCVCL